MRAIRKQFAGENVLRGVDLTLTDGVTVLLGPNGAGKTTLLRVLAGIATPDNGVILSNGTPISPTSREWHARLGYVPQTYTFAPGLTLIAFLRYVSRLKGLPDDLAAARTAAVLTVTGLTASAERPLDRLSGGRLYLGIGAGWFERDYEEYGYEFGTAYWRLRQLAEALPRIESRLTKLDPSPVQPKLPILIGGGGEKVTLRLVAEHADAWNGFGPAKEYARKNAILNDWCEKVGRDPAEIERTVLIDDDEVERWEEFLEAGATHLIVGLGFEHDTDQAFDLAPLRRLIELRDAS
jgi:GTPase SAR1 family protein